MEFIEVVCLEQVLGGRVRCKTPCRLRFPKTERTTSIGRMLIKASRQTCPFFKDMPGQPRFELVENLGKAAQNEQGNLYGLS